MNLAHVLRVVAVVLAVGLGLAALCLVLSAFCPALVERARAHIDRRPGRTFVSGLAMGLPALVGLAILARLPGPTRALAAALGVLLLLHAALGVAALAAHLGGRLRSPKDAARPWLPTLRGAVCLELATALPVLGWFLVGPAALALALGAVTIALLDQEPRARREPAAEGPASAGGWAPAGE